MKKQTASCSASTTTMAIFFAQNFTKIHLGDCRLPGRTRWRGLGDRRFVHHHSKCLLHLQIDAHCHIKRCGEPASSQVPH